MSMNPFFGPTGTLEDEPVHDRREVVDPIMGREEVVYGPLAPVLSVASPAEPVLQRTVVESHPRVWVVGLHGGAGATSITNLIPGAEELPAWPIVLDEELMTPVILVARTHYSGLVAAQNATQEWASGDVPSTLLGLVLVADAPRPGHTLKTSIRDTLHRAPHGWHLPWQESWRDLPVTDRPLSGAASRTLRNIARCLDFQTSQ